MQKNVFEVFGYTSNATYFPISKFKKVIYCKRSRVNFYFLSRADPHWRSQSRQEASRNHIPPVPFSLSALPSSTIICAFYTVCGQFLSPSPSLPALFSQCADKACVVCWNAALRGQALGQRLVECLENHLERECVSVPSLVSGVPQGTVTHLMSQYRAHRPCGDNMGSSEGECNCTFFLNWFLALGFLGCGL